MYYSIPHNKVNAGHPDLTLTRPKPVNEQVAPKKFHRNSSDSVPMVKRRSSNSFEKYYDIEEMLEEIQEIQAAQRGVVQNGFLHQILVHEDEDDDDNHDQLFSDFLDCVHVHADPASSD